jgi:3-hydroxyacyl-CoA dehydrogenase / enoyl-CoA hydratase / 3-hydroxybutyryl-CoA epimerase
VSSTETVHRQDRERVAILELDHPDRSMNVIDERVLADLGVRVEEVLADDRVDALVLASAKQGSFGAGADLEWLPELAARDDAEAFLTRVHDLMLRLVRSPKPMVTALNGPAFGGALELALGGHAIVATEGATLGLPEVTLALLPGGGGTQLLHRFVPVGVAAELLTTGRRVRATEAVELGLVAELADDDRVRDVAVARARGLVGRQLPADPTTGDVTTVDARRKELADSRTGLAPAADHILTALRVGVSEGLEAGLAAERAAFLAVLRSPESRAAVHLFQAEAEVKRRSRGAGEHIDHLGVIGGGQMGAGIAATAVSRGLSAVVRDLEQRSLERARSYRDKVLSRTAPEGEDPRAARWSGTTGWDGFADAGAVIEAVFELPELKTEVLGELVEVVGDETLIATNTSAISIRRLATAVSRPERFLGMHFFSPVDRMPLVELIPHAGTSLATQHRAAALGRQLGKVPVVVGDAPGFFTSRVYARWLVEGIRLLLDGVPPAEVDAAAKRVGFPVGPLQAHDEATLLLVLQASIAQVAEEVLTDRVDVGAVRSALQALLDAGVQGRRHGLGFYRYGEDGKRTGPYDEVLGILGVEPTSLDADLVGERLLLAFATECFACWDDGTLCHPDDGDVAATLGIGFPRVLGGPFHWADELGAAEVVARTEALDPTAFPAGPSLAGFAAGGGRFAEQARRPAPFQPPA